MQFDNVSLAVFAQATPLSLECCAGKISGTHLYCILVSMGDCSEGAAEHGEFGYVPELPRSTKRIKCPSYPHT